MLNSKHFTYLSMIIILYLFLPTHILAKDTKQDEKDPFALPKNVFTITKENTHKNTLDDESLIEPSELTKELLDEAKVKITNQRLIKLLNETSIKPSPISFGYRGNIYLGRWALNYESGATNTNWEYQQINTNEINNIGGNREELLQYVQQGDKEVAGVLTSKIDSPEDVRQMILLSVKEKTDLPVTFRTEIGHNTKGSNKYKVPVEKYGYLYAYVPALHEKGNITFGEVYVELKGTTKALVIKNITKQAIGAWMPLHDHITLNVELK